MEVWYDGFRHRPGTLNVSNLDRATYFYQEAFGFQVIEQQDLQTTLGTSNGTILLVLHKVNHPQPRKETTGLFHIAIRLPNREDLARLVYHLVNNSVDLEGWITAYPIRST